MNILFVTDPTPLGGATSALLMLTKSLKDIGCNITVCVSDTPEVKKRLERNDIQAIDTGHIPAMINRPRNSIKVFAKKLIYSAKRNLFNLPMAKKRVESAIDLKTIDIIYTNSARSDLGCILAKKYGIPHIVHLREFGVEDFGCMFLRRDYYAYLNSNADSFVAVSDAVKESWTAKGINGERIARIYDGIDIGAVIPRTTPVEKTKVLKTVIVGGIMPAKGQHICIKAINELPLEIRTNVTLDIIGWEDPNYRESLEKMIDEYGLKEQVCFLGIKDGVGDILRNYDIGLMASRSEGFGLVTAEYMAAGLCVIASDSGANSELVSNGVNGLLYGRDDYKALASCIVRLYSCREEMERLAASGRDKALKEFDIEICAKRIHELCVNTYSNGKNR